MPEVANPGLQILLDTEQRTTIPDLLRHAPENSVATWLKQELPENGGSGHIPSHRDDFLVALVAVQAAAINDLRERVASLEESLEARAKLPPS